jgi:hypothetical protein
MPFYNFTGSNDKVMDYVRRMRDALAIGFVFTKSGKKISLYEEKGLEIFADMLEGNPQSPNIDFYGILQMYVRHILGHAPTPMTKYHLVPAAAEHYETALRDPAYWYFVKWIVYFFQEYKMHHPHEYYSKEELSFPDAHVKVSSMAVDRLTTYFEWYYSDLSFSVFYNFKYDTEPFHVRARQQRLNHKPFTYTINVESDKTVPAVVRVYLGPKQDPYHRDIDISENRLNFLLIDKFPYTLKSGMNAIVRDSKKGPTVSDRTSYWELYKKIMGAIKGTEEFIVDGSETFFGLPNRLVLPAGKYGGMPFQFYVIVTPYHAPEGMPKPPEEAYYPIIGSSLKWWYDDFAFGYPFDRPIDKSVFYVPNSYFQDVTIYHKKFEDLNVYTHQE